MVLIRRYSFQRDHRFRVEDHDYPPPAPYQRLELLGSTWNIGNGSEKTTVL